MNPLYDGDPADWDGLSLSKQLPENHANRPAPRDGRRSEFVCGKVRDGGAPGD